MQLLGSLLVWVSLGIGTLSAVTAYRPLLETVAASPTQLTLGMPVGRLDPENENDPQPLFEPPLSISPDVMEQLRAAKVRRVGIKEFSFSRWHEKYWFLASLTGLVIGAVLVRRGAAASDSVVSSTEHRDDPINALAQAAVEIEQLVDEVANPNLDPTQRLRRTAEVLERVRRTQMDIFTNGGPRLTRQLGLSGFAQLMDAFAGAERKLNRAWSAAVDNNEIESMACLRDGQEMLREAMKRLDSLKDF